MKNATAIAIAGIVLLIIVNFYFVLVDFQTLKPITHGGRIMEVLAFVGYLALLPFFINFTRDDCLNRFIARVIAKLQGADN